MPILFPTSPTVGQVFTSGGRSWVWTGTTWDSPSTVTAALSGLTLVKSQDIGTAVTSVTVTDAFSATYDAYQIVVSGGVASGSTGMKLQFGSTTTNYRYGIIYQNLGTNAVLGISGTDSSIPYIGSATTNYLNAYVTVLNPFLTRNTHTYSAYNTTTEGGTVTGSLNDNTSYTSFILSTTGAGSWTGGTINVYGYRKA